MFLPPRVEIPHEGPPPLHSLIILVSSHCSVDDHLEDIIVGRDHHWHVLGHLYILLILDLAFESNLQICQHLPIWLCQPLSEDFLAFDERFGDNIVVLELGHPFGCVLVVEAIHKLVQDANDV